MKTVISDALLADKSIEWNVVYPRISQTVLQAVSHITSLSGIAGRDIEKQLLLHLPQFSQSELGDPNIVRGEAERLATKLQARRRNYVRWSDQSRIHNLTASNLRLRECEPAMAQIVHERFHYLGSYHPGIVHLGLYMIGGDGDLPIALASLAPMDIRRLDPVLSREEKKQTLIVSRVFAFDWAPRNTISFLLGRVYNWVKRNLSEIRTLLTFLNPNLGFSGSSFRAANWKSFLEIEPACAYLAGDYVSYRTLAGLPSSARKFAEPCFYHLQPLKLLRYDLDR